MYWVCGQESGHTMPPAPSTARHVASSWIQSLHSRRCRRPSWTAGRTSPSSGACWTPCGPQKRWACVRERREGGGQLAGRGGGCLAGHCHSLKRPFTPAPHCCRTPALAALGVRGGDAARHPAAGRAERQARRQVQLPAPAHGERLGGALQVRGGGCVGGGEGGKERGRRPDKPESPHVVEPM